MDDRKPSESDLIAASVALGERAHDLRCHAEEREKEVDHPRYQSPLDAARELRDRAEALERVVRWLDAIQETP